MLNTKVLVKVGVLSALLVSNSTYAWDEIVTISEVDASHMAAKVQFRVEGAGIMKGSTSCQKGWWFYYSGSEQKTSAGYSLLLAALLANKKVHIFGDDNTTDAGWCNINYLTILKDG